MPTQTAHRLVGPDWETEGPQMGLLRLGTDILMDWWTSGANIDLVGTDLHGLSLEDQALHLELIDFTFHQPFRHIFLQYAWKRLPTLLSYQITTW